MVGYSEKGWLKWKTRRGKWPDLGLNPFPFHFSFINNPPTTQSTLNHKLSTPPPPLLLPHPFLTPTLMPKLQLQEPVGERNSAVVLFSCGSKQRVGKGKERDEGMVDGKMATRMSLSVSSCLHRDLLYSSLSKYSRC